MSMCRRVLVCAIEISGVGGMRRLGVCVSEICVVGGMKELEDDEVSRNLYSQSCD